ncbi:MAG TPA: hypothetical protein VM933_09350 [Acidimicrobiales bacterium]|nr:hypothetical protein [Acidimicrobiales bacterium]
MPRPRPRRSAAWGLAGLALVVAGCGGGPADVATPSTSESAASSAADAPAASATSEAPAADLLSFTAPAIGGGEVDVASFRGRPTLLWFWAPW